MDEFRGGEGDDQFRGSGEGTGAMVRAGETTVSPATRLVAADGKATNRPLAESAGSALELLASVPAESTETRVVSRATYIYVHDRR